MIILFFCSIHFPCGLCIFVGSSQKSLDSHIKWKHVEAMCELCGKSFTCGANLNIHKTEVHKLKPKKSMIGRDDIRFQFQIHIGIESVIMAHTKSKQRL